MIHLERKLLSFFFPLCSAAGDFLRTGYDLHAVLLQFIHHSLNKKSLTDILCQGRISFAVPPCFTVSRALCGIRSYSRQLTYASRRRILSLPAFDCALRGPFGGLFPARLSPCRARCAGWDSIRGACAKHYRTLCKGIAALISASTVSYEITRIVSATFTDVKPFSEGYT